MRRLDADPLAGSARLRDDGVPLRREVLIGGGDSGVADLYSVYASESAPRRAQAHREWILVRALLA